MVESPTLHQQALLYRLCGDKHPLHADPRYAAKGGFERPILHGLCTCGIAAKAVVDELLGGDPAQVSRYEVRFAGVVYPGERRGTTSALLSRLTPGSGAPSPAESSWSSTDPACSSTPRSTPTHDSGRQPGGALE